MKDVRKKKLTLIISIITIIILALSGTYALFKWNSDNTDITLDAHLGIIYKKEHDTLTGTLNPANSKDEGLSTNIELWTTTTRTKVYGTLFFTVKSIDSPLNQNSMLKWELWNNGNKLNEGDFNGFANGDIVELLKDTELSNSKTIYTLYVWLDDSRITSTDISGSTMEVDVGASAVQVPTSESTITVVDNSPAQTTWVKDYTLSLKATSTEYNITGYAVTTSPEKPSTYTSVSTPGLTYNLNYTVDTNDKYFVWFRNQNNKVAYATVDVNKIDNTKPEIDLNGTSSPSIASSSATISIPLKITDTQSGINTSTFTSNSLTVKVGTTTVNPTKTITYQKVESGIYSYILTLTNVTGNGNISLNIPASAISDVVGNTNNNKDLIPNIDIDNTAPVVNSITAEQYTSTITISANATDSYGTIDTYWYSIDGVNYYSSNNSNYTFTNVSSGNYTAYVYVKDKAGNKSNTYEKTVLFDNIPPTLTSLLVTTTSGTYANGKAIDITATYSEDIVSSTGATITSTTAPKLSLKFGSQTAREATFKSASSNKINYQIVINTTDLGSLSLSSYQGTVYDAANNSLTLSNVSLGGNAIQASTKAKIDTTYYTTLASAINTSSTTKTITMVNDTTECVTITSSNNITLDLSGKTVTCTTSNTPLITNNGTLTIKSGTTGGTLNSTYYAIENKGSLTLTSGTIKSTNSIAVNNNSTATNAKGASLYVNGAEVISTSNIGINNATTGIITIASGTVKGTQSGIYNVSTGTINIGLSSDTLSTTSPAIYNTTTSSYGVYMNNGGTLNINNGAIYTANTSVGTAYYKGTSTLTARSGYHVTTSTESVSGVSNKKSYLISGTTQIQYQYRNYDSCIKKECVGGNVTNSSCGYASCVNSNCSCAKWNYTTTCGSWVEGTCEKSGYNFDTTAECNKQGTNCTSKTVCTPGGQAGTGYYCCDYTRTCTKKKTSCNTYNSCQDSSCGYATCYDSCANLECVGGYTAWTNWSTSTLSGYSNCQKRTCNLNSEGVVTTCGTAGSC